MKIRTTLALLAALILSVGLARANQIGNPNFDLGTTGVSTATGCGGFATNITDWSGYDGSCSPNTTTIQLVTGFSSGHYGANSAFVSSDTFSSGLVQGSFTFGLIDGSAEVSAEFYVTSGCAFVGIGRVGVIPVTAEDCTLDRWVTVSAFGTLAQNGNVPYYEMVVFTDNIAGTQSFYVDHVSANPVPEPDTLALFSSGLVGLGCFLRRRGLV